MARQPSKSGLDSGPEFEADSISLPEIETGTLSGPTRKAAPPAENQTSLVWIILGCAVLGVAIGAGAFFATNSPSSASASAVAKTPEDPKKNKVETVTAAGDPTSAKDPKAAKDPSPAKDPVAAAPTPDAGVKAAPKSPDPAKSPATAAKEPDQKLAKGKVKKARGKSSKRLNKGIDDALAKLENLDVDPSPESKTTGSGEGAKAASGSLEGQCAAGSVVACVRAGAAAERAKDPRARSRAQQLYGIACSQGAAAGCARLARLLETGPSGSRNAAQARALRKKACELGHRDSCRANTKTSSAPQ